MPNTADFVDRMRTQWGKAHVNTCLRRAMREEEGWFYAIEGGYTFGAPFPASSPIYQDQRLAVVLGVRYAAFMRWPEPVAAPAAGGQS